jgi:hypothetical protein
MSAVYRRENAEEIAARVASARADADRKERMLAEAESGRAAVLAAAARRRPTDPVEAGDAEEARLIVQSRQSSPAKEGGAGTGAAATAAPAAATAPPAAATVPAAASAPAAPAPAAAAKQSTAPITVLADNGTPITVRVVAPLEWGGAAWGNGGDGDRGGVLSPLESVSVSLLTPPAAGAAAVSAATESSSTSSAPAAARPFEVTALQRGVASQQHPGVGAGVGSKSVASGAPAATRVPVHPVHLANVHGGAAHPPVAAAAAAALVARGELNELPGSAESPVLDVSARRGGAPPPALEAGGGGGGVGAAAAGVAAPRPTRAVAAVVASPAPPREVRSSPPSVETCDDFGSSSSSSSSSSRSSDEDEEDGEGAGGGGRSGGRQGVGRAGHATAGALDSGPAPEPVAGLVRVSRAPRAVPHQAYASYFRTQSQARGGGGGGGAGAGPGGEAAGAGPKTERVR